MPICPPPLHARSIQARKPCRHDGPDPRIQRQRQSIYCPEDLLAGTHVIESQLHARERHRDATPQYDSYRRQDPEERGEIPAEEFVEDRVQGHESRPEHHTDAKEGAGSKAGLQKGKSKEHPEGLREAAQGEEEGDLAGREGEAAEGNGGELEDWGDGGVGEGEEHGVAEDVEDLGNTWGVQDLEGGEGGSVGAVRGGAREGLGDG